MANDTAIERGPRSPGYPSINLEDAIERARILKEYSPSRKPIPVDIAMNKWGFKPKSGSGMAQLAALKKFQLLDDEGSRDTRAVKLSDLAWRILTNPRSRTDPDKRSAIQEAARSPRIHAEIVERWAHGLPDDTTIQIWLVQEKQFNERSVKGFIRQLRETFEFADIYTQDAETEDQEEPSQEHPTIDTAPDRHQAVRQQGSAQPNSQTSGSCEQARITLFGDGDLVVIGPARANPAHRPLVKAWIEAYLDRLFSTVSPQDTDRRE